MWRTLTQPHPRIGYTYVPGVRARLPFDGGSYRFTANSDGFRCAHDFVAARRPGTRRVLLFGDSQTAGDGVSDGHRYGDLLESLCPQTEVYNFGLPGTGPDQHYLVWEDFAAGIEHDLVVIAVYVENIGRVVSHYRVYDDGEGGEQIYGKPWFALSGDRLALGGVPVPPGPVPLDSLPVDERGRVARGAPFPRLRRIVQRAGLKDLAQRVTRFDPVPGYGSAQDPGWRLLRGILTEWIGRLHAPVLVVPLPIFCFTEETADPSHYRTRFGELARDTGARLHDPLDDLRAAPMEVRRGYRFKRDAHFTRQGHRALAESLAPVVTRLLDSGP